MDIMHAASPPPPSGAHAAAYKYEHNLKVLRRRDPSIEAIFDQFSHVCVYHHDGTRWEKQGFEGTMFLYERSSYPPYGLYILNRVGMDDYIQPIHPEDSMQGHEKYLLMRVYPAWTAARLAKLPPPVGKRSKFAPEYKVQGVERLVDAQKGEGVTVGLWCFATDARESMQDVMIRLHSYIKKNIPYPDIYKYSPERPAPSNGIHKTPPQAPAPVASPSLDALFSKLQPSASTSAPLNINALFTSVPTPTAKPQATGTGTGTPTATRGLALLDTIFASASSSSLSTSAATSATTSSPVPSHTNSNSHAQGIISPRPNPQTLNQGVIHSLLGLAPSPATSSAASSPGASSPGSSHPGPHLNSNNSNKNNANNANPNANNTTNTTTNTNSTSNPTATTTTSRKKGRGGRRGKGRYTERYEGDNEDEESDLGASHSHNSSGVLDEDVLVVQVGGNMGGGGLGDRTPRAPLPVRLVHEDGDDDEIIEMGMGAGVRTSTPPPAARTPRGKGKKGRGVLSGAGGPGLLCGGDGEAARLEKSASSSTIKAHFSPPPAANPSNPHPNPPNPSLIATTTKMGAQTKTPFTSADLWPHPQRQPLLESSSTSSISTSSGAGEGEEGEGEEVVELDFADTRALSDMDIFRARARARAGASKGVGAGVGAGPDASKGVAAGSQAQDGAKDGKGSETKEGKGRKKGKKERAEERERREAAPMPAPAIVLAPAPVPQAQTQAQAPAQSQPQPQPQPPTSASASAPQSRVDESAVRASLLSVLAPAPGNAPGNAGNGKALSGLGRNDFVREVLMLIHKDKAFVDRLWAEYNARVA